MTAATAAVGPETNERRPRSRHRLETAGATALYLVYALMITWPLVTDPGGSIYGGIGGDLTSTIAALREYAEHHVFPFAPGTLPDFDAPGGQAIAWTLNLASAPSLLALLAFTYLFGATAAIAVFMWLGLVASGTAMFLLARRVSGSAAAALVAGFGYAFYPFMINKAEGHVHFVHGWMFVLVAWRMLELTERPTLRNGLLAGAATALTMWFTPYFILFGGVLFAVLAVVALVVAALRRTGRPTVLSLAVATGVLVAFVAFLGILQLTGGGAAGSGVQSRPIEQIITYSARPRELVVPDRNNLLFGTELYLSKHLHGSNFSESSLYLGWSLLLLAAIGLAGALRRVVRERRRAARDPRVVAAFAAAVVAIVGAAFAMPPQVTIRGHLVDFPMWYVSQVTTTWRAVSRFVMVVELGVCLLAALGVAALLARRATALRAGLTVVILAVVAVDLWARMPDHVVELTTPTIYARIATLGPGIVAEYPVAPGDYPDYVAMTWQNSQGHPVFQGYVAGSESESRKFELSDLGDSETAGDLAALGVRWLLVRPAYAGKAPGAGFRKVFDEGPESVYEVTAAPSRTQVDALSGFSGVEGESDKHYRWQIAPEGRLLVRGECDPCRGALEFTAQSFKRPRMLTVRDASGRVLGRARITGQRGRMRVPLNFRGQTTVNLFPSPGPEPATPDPRELSILVQEPKFRLNG